MSIRSGPGGGQPDPGLDAVTGERRQLINLTYRLVGSVAEAKDAVRNLALAGTPFPRSNGTPSNPPAA